MAWKCIICGSDNLDESSYVCSNCGNVNAFLQLRGDVGSVNIKFSIEVGSIIYRRLSGDDCRYASNPQYSIMVDGSNFLLIQGVNAIQKTFIERDGVDIECKYKMPIEILDNDVISLVSRKDITKRCCKIQVNFEHK